MNTIKVQLRNTNKKISISDVKTYEQLLALIKKNFSDLPEGASFVYYDADKDECTIDSDETFESYLTENLKSKIIIKLPGEDLMDQSMT